MGSINKCCVEPAAKISVADDVLSQAEHIGQMASALADMADQKLGRICRETTPTTCGPAEERRPYPPYFSDMADKLNRIRYNLTALEDIISRCEV